MAALTFIDIYLNDLRQHGLFRTLRVLEGPQGPHVRIDGRELINMSSNDYLGLANHPDLRQAAKDAVDRYGAGAGAVRTIAGTMDIHEKLEAEIAAWKGAEATLLFQSGFAANLGVIPALVGPEDVILSDALNHASIIDGCRLSRATIRRYAHANPASLRGELEQSGAFQRKLIVTDAVFSMDGDLAPLPAIADLADEFGAIVMIDDAHASGVLGRGGRGSIDHFGLKGRIHVQMGTLSKAIGSMGAYIAGSMALREYLIQVARPFLFSTALPPAVVAASRAAIALLQHDASPVERLWENTRTFKAKLGALGLDTGKSQTPITPVMVGDAERAHRLSNRLGELGVFVQSVAYPTVPRDTARVRVMVSAAHSAADLEVAVQAFGLATRELGLR